jgi:hypothetical protein
MTDDVAATYRDDEPEPSGLLDSTVLPGPGKTKTRGEP